MTPIRALVVDDEPDLRFALTRHLRTMPVLEEIIEVSNAAAALERIRAGDIAVVLLDLVLPDADGLELIPQIARLDPAARVLCLTGRDEARAAVEALHSGASAYIVKPWDREELGGFVRRAVEEHRERKQRELARRSAADAPGFAPGASAAWAHALEQARDAGRSTRATVLIRGESGTGKEVIASLIHRWSPRVAGPFVTSNVASIPSGLLESELFGHEGGAYTGAKGLRRGLFELASEGTLFLDEIGEMPLEHQPRLLRVLEGQPFRRLGGEREVQVDVRIVAATHRDLEAMVAEGKFRADLLYRLKVFEIQTPALRERREDVEPLAIHFLARLAPDSSEARLGISPEALEILTRYDWPGNVRELRNVIERAAVLSHGERIEPNHLPPNILGKAAADKRIVPVDALEPDEPAPLPGDLQLESAIRRHIELVFAACEGNLSRTARTLGLSRVALRRRLRAYGLVAGGDEASTVTKYPPVTDEPAPASETTPGPGREPTAT